MILIKYTSYSSEFNQTFLTNFIHFNFLRHFSIERCYFSIVSAICHCVSYNVANYFISKRLHLLFLVCMPVRNQELRNIEMRASALFYRVIKPCQTEIIALAMPPSASCSWFLKVYLNKIRQTPKPKHKGTNGLYYSACKIPDASWVFIGSLLLDYHNKQYIHTHLVNVAECCQWLGASCKKYSLILASRLKS